MAGYATPAWVNDASPAIDDSALLDIGHGIEIAEHPYGVCSTAAATAAKTVTIDYSGTLTLFTGLTVRVKFTNGNTAASPTLNVNSTGAKSIVYGTSFAAGAGWTAGAVTELTYDGTNWVMSRAAAVDTNPTSGSTNLITSDAVFNRFQRTVNPNLLDNWYFVGGGTGNDVFPVNQRGLTSYTGGGGSLTQCIDRWNIREVNNTLVLSSDGVTASKGTSATRCDFYQRFPTGVLSDLQGKVVTATVLYANGCVTGTFTWGASASSVASDNNIIIYSSGNTTQYTNFCIRVANSQKIYAAKLELGDTQTLCHQENGAWVLNEIPNYAEEYQKCLRYFWNAMKPATSAQLNIPLNRMAGTSDTNINANLTSPVPMRAAPTISGTVQYIRGTCGTTTVSLATGFTLAATANIVGTQIQFTITHSSYVFPSLASGLFAIFTSLQFSAEL